MCDVHLQYENSKTNSLNFPLYLYILFKYYYKQEYDKGTFYYQDEGTGATYCEDCIDYMDAVPKYTYDDSIIIGDVVYALQYEGFCEQV